MLRAFIVVVVTCAALIACSTSVPPSTGLGANSRTPGSATPTSRPFTTSGSAAAASADAAGPGTRVPPPVETTCSVDADCALTSDELIDSAPRTYACCPGCTDHAVTTSWLTRFHAWCERDPAPMCPPIGCAMPGMHAACVAGLCAAKPAR